MAIAVLQDNSDYRGLGMYPDETCFDVNRPGWLPHWIDDLTESKCKINMLVSGNTSGNTAQPGEFMPDPNNPSNVVPKADPSTLANAKAECIMNGGTWNTDLQICEPGTLTKLQPYFIAGGLGLASILLIGIILKR